MSQTLQNQILLAKSMNGIITLSDGAGTTITNGQITTTDISSNTLKANNTSLGAVDLTNSLKLEQYDNISTAVGNVSLWEKGHSYFTYLPQSTATPSNNSDLITLSYANSHYAASGNYVTASGNNTFTGTNQFNNSFSVNCPATTGSITLNYNGSPMIEINQFALYSPLSISPAYNQITFNYAPIFRSNFALDNNVIEYLGTGYSQGFINANWGGINIMDNGDGPTFFKTNTMEPYSTSSINLFTTAVNSQSLIFGNSSSTNNLSIQFANTTFNRPTTFLDNITANSLTITPTQLSFLNNVSSGTIGQSQINNGYVDLTTQQSVSGLKDFNSGYSGIKDLVAYPTNYTRTNAYNNGIISLGSLSLSSLSSVGNTNTGVISIGNTCLSNKTLNTLKTTVIGVSNLNQFTNAAFSYVTVYGSDNIGVPSNYSMTNVNIFGTNTDFNPSGTVNPTSVTNCSFISAPGINLASSTAISNSYALCTDQYITGSNQGIIGRTGSVLNIYGTVNVFSQAAASTIQTGAFTVPTNFNRYNYLTCKTAAGYQVTLCQSNANTVGKEIIFKRIGGSAQIITAIGVAGPEGLTQAVFYSGANLGTIAAGTLLSASQNTTTLVSLMTQDSITNAGTFTNTAGAATVTIVTQTTGTIVIGGVYIFNGNIRSVTSFGTGLGGTGTYNISSAIASANTNIAYSSVTTYAWATIGTS